MTGHTHYFGVAWTASSLSLNFPSNSTVPTTDNMELNMMDPFESFEPFDYNVEGVATLTDHQSTSWDHSLGNSSQLNSMRVCDRCISKKVKCNLNRPACSRCLEDGVPCFYGSAKKRPGPLKGSYRKPINGVPGRKRRPAFASSDSSKASTKYAQLCQTSVPSSTVITAANGMLDDEVQGNFIPNPLPTNELSRFTSIDHHLDSRQERQLIENFFLYIHASVPMFRRENFFQRYEDGKIKRSLLLTIFVIASKIYGLPSCLDVDQLKDCAASLLAANIFDEESPNKLPSLDSFRQACLLAFYEFHQYPGQRASTRITQLTRKAYQYGLHQIDKHEKFSDFNENSSDKSDLEEWRYVWWCIYCLDSYSNITAATPFVVEDESIMTALVTSSLVNTDAYNTRPSTGKVFLPEIGLLWKTTKEITNCGGDLNFNMHIVTTTLLRQASAACRLYNQNPSERFQTRLSAVRDHLSAVRLALPPRFLSPTRHTIADESSFAYHARLVCILHLHTARLLLCTPSDPNVDQGEWLCQWQNSLEYCQDIVSVVRQWDGQFSSTVDPAVCFIIAQVLVLIHLHMLHQTSSQSAFKTRLSSYKDALILFLQQFETIWNLPRFLLISFEKFSRLVPGPLTDVEIHQILGLLQGPLSHKWMNFLSLSVADHIAKPTISKDSQSLAAQEWDFNDWEAITNISAFDDWRNVL